MWTTMCSRAIKVQTAILLFLHGCELCHWVNIVNIIVSSSITVASSEIVIISEEVVDSLGVIIFPMSVSQVNLVSNVNNFSAVSRSPSRWYQVLSSLRVFVYVYLYLHSSCISGGTCDTLPSKTFNEIGVRLPAMCAKDTYGNLWTSLFQELSCFPVEQFTNDN